MQPVVRPQPRSSHGKAQAECLIRDRKERSEERVRLCGEPLEYPGSARAFDAPNLFQRRRRRPSIDLPAGDGLKDLKASLPIIGGKGAEDQDVGVDEEAQRASCFRSQAPWIPTRSSSRSEPGWRPLSAPVRATMASTTCFESRPTPVMTDDVIAIRKCRPTKYRLLIDQVTHRWCGHPGGLMRRVSAEIELAVRGPKPCRRSAPQRSP